MQVVQHLLADCTTCREKLLELGWDDRRLERLLYVGGWHRSEESPAVDSRYNYDKAFAKADNSLTAFFAPVKPLQETVEDLFAEIMSLPVEGQARRVAQDKRFASPQLVHHLIDHSHAVRYKEPEQMLHLANLARLAGNACEAETAGGELGLADLRTRAWGHYGNSLRVCGYLKEAEDALNRAAHEREKGTGDPLLRARLLEQKTSLLVHQRNFEQAIEAIEQACQIYREVGDSHLLAAAIISKANATSLIREVETAADLLNSAIPLIDCESDPHLLLAACHNLINCYIELAQPDLALSLYAETRDLYQEFGDQLILLRAGWREGQLLRDMGHLRQAESKLLEVQKGFLERRLTFEPAIVSLDLAALYLKIGATEDVRQTAAAAVPIFRALGVDREALAALLQLQQVADQEQQAMELIRFLNARIEPLSKRGLLK